jgi:hypothetical protein
MDVTYGKLNVVILDGCDSYGKLNVVILDGCDSYGKLTW